MDTGTHIVMGFGLVGLATLDPVITGSPATAEAVMFGTVVGSVVPDIDTVWKLKDNATYIRHHRGFTHSLPATGLWPLVIVFTLMLVFPAANLFHLWLWTMIAVGLHVFVDIFNAYGTQALRPISYRWIALDVINIFDPVIFGVHLIGFLIWYFVGHPGITFLCIYLILFFYYLLRFFHHNQAVRLVQASIQNTEAVYLSPTIKWSQYHLAARTKDTLIVGEINQDKVTIFDRFERKDIPDTPIFNKAKTDKNVTAFLAFSPIFWWEIEEHGNLVEVRLIDLRYLSDGHYPFVAIVWLDSDLTIRSSFTGWVYSEDKLQKKLTLAMDDY